MLFCSLFQWEANMERVRGASRGHTWWSVTDFDQSEPATTNVFEAEENEMFRSWGYNISYAVRSPCCHLYISTWVASVCSFEQRLFLTGIWQKYLANKKSLRSTIIKNGCSFLKGDLNQKFAKNHNFHKYRSSINKRPII